jgi:metal-sulfur cluster biosynthetic enzyme
MSEEQWSNKASWLAEKTHPELIEPLREALRAVVDPEIGLNVIELGLIRDVRIEENNADITMILTTPFCPYGPAMLDTTRRKAEEALNRPVNIEMGVEMWDYSMMEEGAEPNWGMY